MTGERFENHSIPLEVLKDLAVLEQLIPALARAEYLRDHPDRTYKPKGFTDGLELRLAGVGEGSAKPLIVLAVAAATLVPMEGQAYVERAANRLVQGLAAAQANRPFREHLPESILSYFDRFGRSLRGGEAVVFPGVNGGEDVRFTPTLRRTLVLSREKNRFITEEVELRGRIPDAHQREMTFELLLDDGTVLRGPIAPEHFDDVSTAWNGFDRGTRVVVHAIAKLDRDGRIQSLEAVEQLAVLDALDVPTRLDEFRGMSDGWLEGEGVAPPADGLDWLTAAFSSHYPAGVRLPRCYPTPAGGIQMEWENDDDDASLEIDLNSRQGRWHVLHFADDSETQESFDLNEADAWATIGKRVESLFGAPA